MNQRYIGIGKIIFGIVFFIQLCALYAEAEAGKVVQLFGQGELLCNRKAVQADEKLFENDELETTGSRSARIVLKNPDGTVTIVMKPKTRLRS